MHSLRLQSRKTCRPRPGFTLIELLVAIGILIVLSALTFSMVNVTMEADRIRSGSRDVQSYLEGARNQAIYAKEPRGVRFLLSPDDPFPNKSTVNSMLYIGPPSKFGVGTTVGITNGSTTIVVPPAVPPAVDPPWTNLTNRGLLVNGARIKIPKTGGEWYTMSLNGANWELTKAYTGLTNPTESYELELAPAVLPNQEPRLLPNRVVIDLDNSKLPGSWITGAGPPPTYSTQLDVLFTPRGNVQGTVGAAGRVHFVLSDTADTTVNCPIPSTISAWGVGVPYAAGDWVVSAASTEYQFLCTVAGTSGAAEPVEFSNPQVNATITGDGTVSWLCVARRPSLVVSLTTQTGNVASYPVHPTDPFLFAETGEVAQ